MHLVEDDLIGMADAPEPGDEGEDSHKDEGDLVFHFAVGLGRLRLVLRYVLELDIGYSAILLL